MKTLNNKEIESVQGGFVFLAGVPAAVKAGVAVAAAIGSIYAAYSAGKGIGSDIIQGMDNS